MLKRGYKANLNGFEAIFLFDNDWITDTGKASKVGRVNIDKGNTVPFVTDQDDFKVFSATSLVYTKPNQIEAFGKVRLMYKDVDLNAGYVRINNDAKQVFVKGIADPNWKTYTELPVLKLSKNDKPFTADSAYFDFKNTTGTLWTGGVKTAVSI